MERKYFNLENSEKIKEADELVKDLSPILNKIGIEMEILILKNEKMGQLFFEYDKEDISYKFSRKAGVKEKFIDHSISPEEARERMSTGESAEKIAAELGISRSTFFRRLKNAEVNYLSEL